MGELRTVEGAEEVLTCVLDLVCFVSRDKVELKVLRVRFKLGVVRI